MEENKASAYEGDASSNGVKKSRKSYERHMNPQDYRETHKEKYRRLRKKR